MLDSVAIYSKGASLGLDSYYDFNIGLDVVNEKVETSLLTIIARERKGHV